MVFMIGFLRGIHKLKFPGENHNIQPIPSLFQLIISADLTADPHLISNRRLFRCDQPLREDDLQLVLIAAFSIHTQKELIKALPIGFMAENQFRQDTPRQLHMIGGKSVFQLDSPLLKGP